MSRLLCFSLFLFGSSAGQWFLAAQEVNPFADKNSSPVKYHYLKVLQTETGPELIFNREVVSEEEFDQAILEMDGEYVRLSIVSETQTRELAKDLKLRAEKAGIRKVRHEPHLPLSKETIALIEKGSLVQLENPLANLSFPVIELEDTPLRAGVDFMRAQSQVLDYNEYEKKYKGVNIVLFEPPGEPVFLNLRREDVSLGELLIEVEEQAGLELTIENDAVVLASPGEAREVNIWSEVFPDSPAGKTQSRLLSLYTSAGIEFNQTPLPDALDFLREQFKELTSEKGALSLKFPGNMQDPPPRVTLGLNQISLYSAVKYTCEAAGADFKITEEGAVILPGSD